LYTLTTTEEGVRNFYPIYPFRHNNQRAILKDSPLDSLTTSYHIIPSRLATAIPRS
jgi:hypothetical protein